MSYDLTNDSDPVPGPPLPGISAERLQKIRRWLTILAIVSSLAIAGWWLVGVYADWLWYDQLGYSDVFLAIVTIKTSLFLVGGLLAATLLALNFSIVLPLSLGPFTRPLPADFLRLSLAILRGLIYVSMLVSGLVFGAAASERWELVILLLYQAPFGVTDPQFGRDVTFYVVNLEILRFIQSWFLALTITVIVLSVTLYAAIYLLRGLRFVLTPKTLRHLASLGIFLMLVLAFHHILSIYELTLSGGGVVAGATNTDVQARIPVYWFLAGMGVLAAAGFGVSIYLAGLRLMVGVFSLWLIMFIVAGIVFPFLFQRFRVDPDEFAREQPYIQRNIEATRAAYGLNEIEESVFTVAESLSEAAAREHRQTIEGIRLWDAAPLQDAYNQLQFMELYYGFVNMDSDRYVVNGQLQQVLVGARELAGQLPAEAERWVNQKLQYTHGYGVSMTPATGYTPGEGRPEYFIQDIPIRGDLPVKRPEVYYGEADQEFAIVNSGMREVNPGSDSWNYDGEGGVPLHSAFRRIVYALKFGDVNILLSDQVTEQSRIQYRRHIRERVKAVAPFLKLDVDPYPVVDEAGKIWWIQDAYTVTRKYPYSATYFAPEAPAGDPGLNYIRNSVKAVVDAYDGGVHLYVMEPDEPLLVMYSRAFPELFLPFSAMPEGLKAHIRYPITLFSAQSQMYLRYHVTDSQVFFNQAEQWNIPLESRFGKPGVRVTPTYVMVRLPGEDAEEFVLMMPFSPAGEKKNLVGWLAARNDPPNYGQLRSYLIPDDRQIDGPSQVEARIENDQEISQQFTLWNGSGSQIIRGRLLSIPIADTIVYVEPLYLQSTVLNFPELKKVILADNTNLVMADSMAEGVARLTGADYGAFSDSGTGSQPPGPAPSGQLEQLDQIEATIDELGAALKDLEESLQNLRNTLGGSSP
ncbi:MAG: UPF0182 family protein [Chloroflexi bacterium]|nr:UPF0182 family protein [Chloroflexota bacterium]